MDPDDAAWVESLPPELKAYLDERGPEYRADLLERFEDPRLRLAVLTAEHRFHDVLKELAER